MTQSKPEELALNHQSFIDDIIAIIPPIPSNWEWSHVIEHTDEAIVIKAVARPKGENGK